MAERRPIPIARSTTLCGQVTYEQARPGEIVTRLREVASWCPDDESYEGFVLLAEAADEIERLRAERDNLLWRNRLLRQRPDLPADRIPAHAEMERLQAEIERLGQRLDEIITAATSGAGSAAVYAAIDRAALSGSDERG